MPTRVIREGILTSARINRLSFMAELFYRRLMTVADDYGRYHASPVTLRGACFPTCPERVTEKQIQGWLNECLSTDIQLISIYESMGFKYLQIANFGQQIRGKSKFPDPPLISNCLAGANQMSSLVVVGVGVEGEVGVVTARTAVDAIKSHTRKTTIPCNSLPPDWRAYAVEKLGWDNRRAEDVFETMRLWAISKASTYSDWLAAWQGWCRREQSKNSPPSRANGKLHDPSDTEYRD